MRSHADDDDGDDVAMRLDGGCSWCSGAQRRGGAVGWGRRGGRRQQGRRRLACEGPCALRNHPSVLKDHISIGGSRGADFLVLPSVAGEGPCTPVSWCHGSRYCRQGSEGWSHGIFEGWGHA
jgi:hypothetical protein